MSNIWTFVHILDIKIEPYCPFKWITPIQKTKEKGCLITQPLSCGPRGFLFHFF